jgi:hypothetical protein
MKRLACTSILLLNCLSLAVSGLLPVPTLSAQAPATVPQSAAILPRPIQHRHQSLSNNRYYTNSSGAPVHSPVQASTAPAGASALCRDGNYSFSQHHQGTCSHHGGVAQWR